MDLKIGASYVDVNFSADNLALLTITPGMI